MSKRGFFGLILCGGACLLPVAPHARDVAPPPPLTLTVPDSGAGPAAPATDTRSRLAPTLVLPEPFDDRYVLVEAPLPPEIDAAQRARQRFAEAVARLRATERARGVQVASPEGSYPPLRWAHPFGLRRAPPVWMTIGNGF